MQPTSGAVIKRASHSLAACACLIAAGCAEAPAKSAKYPGASQTLCQYVGLESVETPQYSDRDAISLLAVYRFREPNTPAPREPLTVKFQVNRSRLNELRNHLESQPEVVCTPDRDLHYHVLVKPFELTPAPEPASSAPAPGSLSPALVPPPAASGAQPAPGAPPTPVR